MMEHSDAPHDGDLSRRSAATSLPTPRQYMGVSDLAALLQFASRSLAERYPLEATWHPGDIAWQLMGKYGEQRPIWSWERDGAVEAVAWFDGPGQLCLEATPAGEPWIPDIVAWAESSLLRERNAEEMTPLSVRAFQTDRVRIAALTRLGFQRSGPDHVHFELDLTLDPPDVDLPPGFAVRDCLDIDPEQRAACHRDAWNALDHIGIENALSTFSTAKYETLRASPAYRPDLDLVGVAPDGTLVASCICWSDAPSGVGTFEPMGTHPDFRGRRLARALLSEGLRRMRALGCRRGRIATAHFNTSAITAYSSLFRQVDQSEWWSKKL
jgi:ribosomal protein S18 acetylase RimI-like enzyme